MNNSSVGAGDVQLYCAKDVPSEAYRIYRITIEVYVVTVVCIFGFVGNGLSIAVLCRDKDRKNATNWLLQTLGVVDSLYLICCLFIQAIKCTQDYTGAMPWLVHVFPYIEPYMWAIGSCVQTITVWMVLLVTIDRYAAICKPLDTQLRSEWRVKCAVIFVVCGAILYNIPRFFERETIDRLEEGTNRTIACTVKTKLRESKTYFLVYKTIMYLVFRSVGPLIVIIYINIRLILTLLLVRRRQKATMVTKRTKKRPGENVTSMLVAVVSMFIVCEIPDAILRIVYTINHYSPYVNIPVSTLRVANVFTNLLLTFNSAINFIIYCLIGKKFRIILARMTNCVTASSPVTERTDVSETDPLTLGTMANQNCAIAGSTNGLNADVKL